VFGDVAGLASCDTLQTRDSLCVWFWVEGNVLEVGVAFVTVEARWVKALATG
jgi:hypothetical protein